MFGINKINGCSCNVALLERFASTTFSISERYV